MRKWWNHFSPCCSWKCSSADAVDLEFMFKMGSGHHAGFEEGWFRGKDRCGHQGALPLVTGAGGASIQCCCVNSGVLGPSSVRPSCLRNCGNCGVLLLSLVVHFSSSSPPRLRIGIWRPASGLGSVECFKISR